MRCRALSCLLVIIPACYWQEPLQRLPGPSTLLCSVFFHIKFTSNLTTAAATSIIPSCPNQPTVEPVAPKPPRHRRQRDPRDHYLWCPARRSGICMSIFFQLSNSPVLAIRNSTFDCPWRGCLDTSHSRPSRGLRGVLVFSRYRYRHAPYPFVTVLDRHETPSNISVSGTG